MAKNSISDEGKKGQIFYLEDMYCLRHSPANTVTVYVDKWHYYIDRVKLTFVEGYYRSYEEMQNAISQQGKMEPESLYPRDYPQHFEIVCRPEHMLRLAEALQNVCEPRLGST